MSAGGTSRGSSNAGMEEMVRKIAVGRDPQAGARGPPVPAGPAAPSRQFTWQHPAGQRIHIPSSTSFQRQRTKPGGGRGAPGGARYRLTHRYLVPLGDTILAHHLSVPFSQLGAEWGKGTQSRKSPLQRYTRVKPFGAGPLSKEFLFVWAGESSDRSARAIGCQTEKYESS